MSRWSLPCFLLTFPFLLSAACGAPEPPRTDQQATAAMPAMATMPAMAPTASAAVPDGLRSPSSSRLSSGLNSTLSSKLVYFGRLEVEAGALKSADGSLPQPGDAVTLRLFLPELGQFLCRDSCMALHPHLFVRFKGSEDFQEVPGIPQGDYVSRGPAQSWPRDTADVVLYIPSDADRMEAYMYWGRIGWNRAACTLSGGVMDCPSWFDLSSEYLSNFGRNFRLEVTP